MKKGVLRNFVKFTGFKYNSSIPVLPFTTTVYTYNIFV